MLLATYLFFEWRKGMESPGANLWPYYLLRINKASIKSMESIALLIRKDVRKIIGITLIAIYLELNIVWNQDFP